MPLIYEFDATGTDPANLIEAELRAVVAPVDPERANYFVPINAPYFATSMIIRSGPLPTDPILTPGVDYQYTHHFVELSHHLSVPIYGSIMLVNQAYAGSLYLTYQTVGGDFIQSNVSILENLTRSLYNIRTVTWSQVARVPQFFPPLPHVHDTADMTGHAETIAAINLLTAAVVTASGNIPSLVSTLTNHLTQIGGSHTPNQVGLGNVANYSVATLADLVALANNKYMTPYLTQQMIDTSLAQFANYSGAGVGTLFSTPGAGSFVVKAGETVRIIAIGAGGGGGGYTTNGTSGGATTVTAPAGLLLTATGGTAGNGGYGQDEGSDLTPIPVQTSPTINRSLLPKFIVNQRNQADLIPASLDIYGVGGSPNPLFPSNWVRANTGGKAAAIDIVYRNDTGSPETLTFNIGAGGDGGDVSAGDGAGGCIMVVTASL